MPLLSLHPLPEYPKSSHLSNDLFFKNYKFHVLSGAFPDPLLPVELTTPENAENILHRSLSTP